MISNVQMVARSPRFGWRPGAVQRRLGQEEAPQTKPIFNFDDHEVTNFFVTNGIAYGYAIAAGLFYGKSSYKLIDRILLGTTGLLLGYASYNSFRLLPERGFREGIGFYDRSTGARAIAGLVGALDGLGAIGTLFAAFSPRLGKKERRQELLSSAVQAIAG